MGCPLVSGGLGSEAIRAPKGRQELSPTTVTVIIIIIDLFVNLIVFRVTMETVSGCICERLSRLNEVERLILNVGGTIS